MLAIDRLRSRLAGAATGQEGFTLTEMLLVVVISGIIVGCLTSAMFVSVHAGADVKQRVAESADAQQVTAFFAADAASASTAAVAPAGAPACGTTPNGFVKVAARFTWSGSTADYYVASLPIQLSRRLCSGATVTDDHVLVRQLQTGTVPTVTCPPPSPKPDCSGDFASVQMTILEVNERVGNLTYAVQGSPKQTPDFQSPGTGPDNTALLLFGSGLTLSGGSTVTVNSGGAVFNDGTASFNGSGSDVFAAGGYGTHQGTCPSDISSTTPCEAGLPLVPDPFAGLTASGFGQYVWDTNCPAGNCTHQGYYTNTVDLSGSNKNVTFTAPGFYWLGQGLDGSSNNSSITTTGTGTVYLYVRNGAIDLTGQVHISPTTHLVIVSPSMRLGGGVDMVLG